MGRGERSLRTGDCRISRPLSFAPVQELGNLHRRHGETWGPQDRAVCSHFK